MSTKLSDGEITQLFEILSSERPNPRTELTFTTPFTLLVAVVLSAQATDVGVNRVTRSLFRDARTPEQMIALGEGGVREHIRSLGLFRNKAKNVIKLSEQLVERHEGHVPSDRDSLEALAGVGRKTANVVLSQAFGQATLAVDTHVFRVANRTGLAHAKTERAVEDELMKRVPEHFISNAHHWLILHGRYVCKARNPDCPRCKISHLCRYESKVVSPQS